MSKLDTVKSSKSLAPPRVVMYGPHGIGKSTFAASAPKPIVIQTEDGLGNLNVDCFPLSSSFDDALSCVDALINESHEYQTVVVDSLDWLERLIHRAVADGERKSSIEKVPYGKGYVFAADAMYVFLRKLDELRDQGMVVIATAHERVARYDDPRTDAYDRAGLALDKRAAPMVVEWCDVLAYAHQDIHLKKEERGFGRERARAVSTGDRVIGLQPNPAYDAKNRYGLDSTMPLDWTALVAAIREDD